MAKKCNIQEGGAILYNVLPEPKNTGTYQHKVLIGCPTLGTVRIEWANALMGVVIPTNWMNSTSTPIGFLVHDGQNIVAQEAVNKGFEWLMLIEDDVMVPPDVFVRFREYMDSEESPIVSGLYHLKASNNRPKGAEPLMYRGRGAGAFRNWKPGDKVWVDGVPTGCLLIHTSILKEMMKVVDDYEVYNNGSKVRLKAIFETPRKVWFDSGTQQYQKLVGTSDLYFCDKVIEHGILKKAGWRGLANRKYPFLVDTGIRCGHIDRNTGIIY